MSSDRSEYKKEWYRKNKERLLEKQKVYNLENKNDIALYQSSYQDNNKEKIAIVRKEYYIKNKKEILTKSKERDLARRRIDPVYKLRRNCSTMIWQALHKKKNGLSILKYLTYSMKDLKIHLESQFDEKTSWENYGSYWHIDHIIPQSKLSYTSMEDDNFKKCWALDNLRPLEAIANIKKSNK